MSLRLREEIQEMLHGQGEVIIPCQGSSKERKHIEKFWKIISNKSENYGKNEKELLEYWFLIKKVVNNNKP